MDLSIIIVSWNVKEKLSANLSALFKSKCDFSFEVYLVDNNSQDGSVALVKNKFPQVKVINNLDNYGFSRANNQALKLAQGRFILLLNPDMQIKPDTLIKTLKWAKENPQATVTACKLLDREGKIIKQVRRFPKLYDQLLIVFKFPHLFPKLLKHYLFLNFDYNSAARVDSIRGAFFLINRYNYQKISGANYPLLDERYFLWFEEVDFCREVYKLGGEVWYTPVAEAVDYIGSSFCQLTRKKSQKYFQDSMLKYFKKWEKKWKYSVLKIAWSFINIFI